MRDSGSAVDAKTRKAEASVSIALRLAGSTTAHSRVGGGNNGMGWDGQVSGKGRMLTGARRVDGGSREGRMSEVLAGVKRDAL